MSQQLHNASQRLNQWLDGAYTYKNYRCGGKSQHPSLHNDVRTVLTALPAWPVEEIEDTGIGANGYPTGRIDPTAGGY